MSAFNGSGTFVISGTGLPYVTGTTISSTVANQLNTDLASGLSNVICKDGQTTPTANIPMGNFKITGLGAATNAGDALSYGGVIGPKFRVTRATSNQTGIPSGVATGVAFNNATYDTTALVNTTTGVMTCNLAGLWQFDCGLLTAGTFDATNFQQVSFAKNGTIYSGAYTLSNTSSGALTLSAQIPLAASDTVAVRVTVSTSGGGTYSIVFSASGADTWWNGSWIGG